MTDPTSDETELNARRSATGMPTWVMVFIAIGLLLLAFLVFTQFMGGGDHGPGRHGASGETQVSTSSEDGAHVPRAYNGP
jgi:hypothetical protein